MNWLYLQSTKDPIQLQLLCLRRPLPGTNHACLTPYCLLLHAVARASFRLDYTSMYREHVLETPEELTVHLCKHYATTTTEI